MQVNKVIKRYETFIGKGQYELRDLVDLLHIHDVDYNEISGIDTLSEENEIKVKHFLVKFFNAWGLETRASIKPVSVHTVVERCWWIDHPETKTRIWIKSEQVAFDKTGKILFKFYEHVEKEYLYLLPRSKKNEEVFLRFDFTRGNGGVEWLHIVGNGFSWY
ncbi:MAG: hypothetical protein E7231_03200 [Cellulosilyticum sp.]|nr:hypothetical protein [Cellulosilyticum sp.]